MLVDPPFEEPGEFDRIVDGLAKAYRRWPGGIYALWYPVKDRVEVADFRERLGNAGIAEDPRHPLRDPPPSPEPRLDGCGMIVVNPPFTLEAEMQVRAARPARAAGRRPPRRLVDGMAGARVRLQSFRPRS